MKKTFAMMTAICMIATSLTAVSAFAEEPNITMDPEIHRDFTQTDIDVTVGAAMDGTIKPSLSDTDAEELEQKIVDMTGHESTPKVYVEVEWEELEFTYDFGTVVDYDWNLSTLTYDPILEYVNGKEAAWEDNDAVIRFHSYSNRPVYVGVSFEKNSATTLYDDVEITFDKTEERLESAAGRGIQSTDFTMYVDGTPDEEIYTSVKKKDVPNLGALKFYISEYTRKPAPEEPATESGEHEHHYVYDQFGRLVCTGCNAIKHEYCIDMDEDGLCDECGLERDFCEDCHVGGKCICT